MIPLQLPAGPLRAVCLGAHPDDIEIGCGATLLRLGQTRQLTVDYVVLTGTPERHREAEEAAIAFLPGAAVATHLSSLPDGRLPAHWGEVKERLEDAGKVGKPDIVFAPRADDAHQDHRLVAEMAPTVWRDSLVLHYEIPKWDGDLGRVNHYVPVETAIVDRKLALLNQCFRSQVDRDWWDDETFRSLMRLRGIECRTRYAEAFAVAKAILA